MTRPDLRSSIPRHELDANQNLLDELARLAVAMRTERPGLKTTPVGMPRISPIGLTEGRPAYGLTGDPLVQDGVNSWLDF